MSAEYNELCYRQTRVQTISAGKRRHRAGRSTSRPYRVCPSPPSLRRPVGTRARPAPPRLDLISTIPPRVYGTRARQGHVLYLDTTRRLNADFYPEYILYDAILLRTKLFFTPSLSWNFSTSLFLFLSLQPVSLLPLSLLMSFGSRSPSLRALYTSGSPRGPTTRQSRTRRGRRDRKKYVPDNGCSRITRGAVDFRSPSPPRTKGPLRRVWGRGMSTIETWRRKGVSRVVMSKAGLKPRFSIIGYHRKWINKFKLKS